MSLCENTFNEYENDMMNWIYFIYWTAINNWCLYIEIIANQRFIINQMGIYVIEVLLESVWHITGLETIKIVHNHFHSTENAFDYNSRYHYDVYYYNSYI